MVNRWLTYGETVVPPGVCDAVGGRADRCVSWVCQSWRLLMGYSLAILCFCSRELTLQHMNAAAWRVDVGRDAQRADTKSPTLPWRAHRRGDSHYAWRVHAEGDKEVLPRMLRWPRSHHILDYQRVNIEGPRHCCTVINDRSLHKMMAVSHLKPSGSQKVLMFDGSTKGSPKRAGPTASPTCAPGSKGLYRKWPKPRDVSLNFQSQSPDLLILFQNLVWDASKTYE